MCSDGLFLYVGRNQDDGPNMHRFCIWQEETGKIETFGTYPADDRIIDKLPADDFSRPTAYQGTAELSPDRSKAVVTYYYAVGFDILDLPGRRISNSVFYQYPQVESVTIPQLKVGLCAECRSHSEAFWIAVAIMSIFMCFTLQKNSLKPTVISEAIFLNMIGP